MTDAYLLGLAIKRGGMLATLDERIAALTQPKSAERKVLEIVASPARGRRAAWERGGLFAVPCGGELVQTKPPACAEGFVQFTKRVLTG